MINVHVDLEKIKSRQSFKCKRCYNCPAP